MTNQLNILIFGAHPDDPDYSAGGVAALYAQQGHQVKMVSLTNGDAGHHTEGGVPFGMAMSKWLPPVKQGVEYITMGIHDGASATHAGKSPPSDRHHPRLSTRPG